MPVEEAKYHMKRCVDSGLWVPNAADLNDEDTDSKSPEKNEESTKKEEGDKEPIYTGVSSDDLD